MKIYRIFIFFFVKLTQMYNFFHSVNNISEKELIIMNNQENKLNKDNNKQNENKKSENKGNEKKL